MSKRWVRAAGRGFACRRGNFPCAWCARFRSGRAVYPSRRRLKIPRPGGTPLIVRRTAAKGSQAATEDNREAMGQYLR